MEPTSNLLTNKKVLVTGLTDRNSIAYGCAKQLILNGAEVALTYLNERSYERSVASIAEELSVDIVLPLDVTNNAQIKSLFSNLKTHWDTLDGVIHSMAAGATSIEELQGNLIDSTRKGFDQTMYISAESFLYIAKEAKPMLKHGSSLMCMSYLGANEIIDGYHFMSPAKAALEAISKNLAVELGKDGIRTNIISPGTMMTKAGSCLKDFEQMMEASRLKTPNKLLATIFDVGDTAVFLTSDLSKSINGQTMFVDNGYHITR
jgi:enoyl-[acyl-carrier protein] reductase I